MTNILAFLPDCSDSYKRLHYLVKSRDLAKVSRSTVHEISEQTYWLSYPSGPGYH